MTANFTTRQGPPRGGIGASGLGLDTAISVIAASPSGDFLAAWNEESTSGFGLRRRKPVRAGRPHHQRQRTVGCRAERAPLLDDHRRRDPPRRPAPGFTYDINWGDGTPAQVVAASTGNGAGLSISHTFTTPGTYSVQVTAHDDNGATGPVTTEVVQVDTTLMQGDDLLVGGPSGQNNTIVLSMGSVAVTVNGQPAGDFDISGAVTVYRRRGTT